MTLRDKIAERLTELGRGPTVAEKKGGLSKMFISDILSNKKRSITMEHWGRLAAALDMTDEELSAYLSADLKIVKIPARSSGKRPHTEAIPAGGGPLDPYGLPQDVPVRGVAAGSVVGAFVIDGVIDRVRRPPGLSHSTNVYALYVTGTSMSPKYEPGDLIYVNPDRPAAPGDTVIIQTQNYENAPIQAWIKRLVSQNDEVVVAAQLNPESVVRYGYDTVISVHRVMKTNELFGV